MGPAQKATQRNNAENPTASFIFLHGFGDDADGWTNIAEQFRGANKLPHLNWIFPNAPHSHNSGTTAWFEPSSFTPIPVGRSTNEASNNDPFSSEETDLDEEGILQSVGYVCSLIQAEVEAGIPLKRIVIGGFSQGCFVTLVTALGSRFGGRIAGVVGLSGGLAIGSRIKEELSGFAHVAGYDSGGGDGDGQSQGEKMRVFLAHGTKDMLVPVRIYRKTLERVEAIVGNDCIEGHEYEGLGHATSGKEFLDMCQFLEKVVPA